MQVFKIVILSCLLFSFFLLPNFAKAQITIENPLRADTITELIEGILNFIFWVATALAPLMIVIAGFYFLTSGGNPQQIATAKRIILYTVIGYAIIITSKGLILILKEILGVT